MIKREEYALVLDFLPYGRSSGAQREPVAQIVGETYFTLLEVFLKPGTTVAMGDRLYIGRSERDKVDHIAGRITYAELTNSAQKELAAMLRKIVEAREQEFVGFLNRAGPINIRAHTLEQLPSIGKKHLQGILNERNKKPFAGFQDARERVPTLGNIEHIFVERILEEMRGESKYYLFTKPMRSEEDEYGR